VGAGHGDERHDGNPAEDREERAARLSDENAGQTPIAPRAPMPNASTFLLEHPRHAAAERRAGRGVMPGPGDDEERHRQDDRQVMREVVRIDVRPGDPVEHELFFQPQIA